MNALNNLQKYISLCNKEKQLTKQITAIEEELNDLDKLIEHLDDVVILGAITKEHLQTVATAQYNKRNLERISLGITLGEVIKQRYLCEKEEYLEL